MGPSRREVEKKVREIFFERALLDQEWHCREVVGANFFIGGVDLCTPSLTTTITCKTPQAGHTNNKKSQSASATLRSERKQPSGRTRNALIGRQYY